MEKHGRCQPRPQGLVCQSYQCNMMLINELDRILWHVRRTSDAMNHTAELARAATCADHRKASSADQTVDLDLARDWNVFVALRLYVDRVRRVISQCVTGRRSESLSPCRATRPV